MMEPVAYQRKLEGKSNAHLITFNDGNDYVVKYFQPGFEKSLPNEWVSYCLARYLGLPVSFAQIVEIPTEFSAQILELQKQNSTELLKRNAQIPKLQKENAQISELEKQNALILEHLKQNYSCFQFASRYIPNCSNGHQITNIAQITNHHELAGVILFDYWLCNTDRTRKNILLQEDAKDTYKLWIIDHAEVFGTYNWQLTDLDLLPNGLIKSATHQLMASFIKNEEHFLEQLEIIQTIPILLIEEIVELIPEDWFVSKEEKKAMVSTLLHRRRKILPKVMSRFIKRVYKSLHN
ncbi:HipA family kinase [Calidifontibacillus oryziterrae]|uniref:HipA family kinase n=1 Tax=Calidifontibacillus oryziterrae TaxID=1191699 RepID=UPI0003070E2A|nr:HipA family kinase [Calidifontibacillus oryziterrae]